MSLAHRELERPRRRHRASPLRPDGDDSAAMCRATTRWSTAGQDQP